MICLSYEDSQDANGRAAHPSTACQCFLKYLSPQTNIAAADSEQPTDPVISATLQSRGHKNLTLIKSCSGFCVAICLCRDATLYLPPERKTWNDFCLMWSSTHRATGETEMCVTQIKLWSLDSSWTTCPCRQQECILVFYCVWERGKIRRHFSATQLWFGVLSRRSVKVRDISEV